MKLTRSTIYFNKTNISFFFQSQTKTALLVFCVGLLLRLYFSLFTFQHYIQSDGIVYHNLAVNVTLGNGYSRYTQPPYDPTFWREPAYPLFLAGVYSIYNIFDSPRYLKTNEIDLSRNGEIKWARIAQAFLGASCCVLFYYLVNLILNRSIASCISILFALYIPFASYTSMLMRETLQTFAVLLMAYTFARFLISEKIFWLFLFSIAWSISNMTLQITLFVGIFLLTYCYIWFRSISKSFLYTFLPVLVMFVLISPWVLRTYHYYSDWNVMKSLGTSITYESAAYSRIVSQLNFRGDITREKSSELLHEWYYLPEYKKFELSFTGFFEAKADSLRLAYPPITIKDQFLQYFANLRSGWIETLWISANDDGRIHMRPHSLYLKNESYFFLILSIFPFLFGYVALLGIVLFFKRSFVITMMFTYFLILLPFIANEPRRSLPIHGFIFLFSCLTIYYLYLRYIKNETSGVIYNRFFKTP